MYGACNDGNQHGFLRAKLFQRFDGDNTQYDIADRVDRADVADRPDVPFAVFGKLR